MKKWMKKWSKKWMKKWMKKWSKMSLALLKKSTAFYIIKANKFDK